MKILNTNIEIRNFLGRNPLQSISIRVTQRCNLKCRHCYASAGKLAKNELKLEEIKKILMEAKDLGAIRVFFGGGEPFLRTDIVEIFQFAKDNGYSIYTSTNGTIVTPETLKKVANIGLKVFQVSIDGIGETDDNIRGVKGTFEKSIKTLENASKLMQNSKVALAFVLSKANETEAIKMLELAVDKKVDIFALIPLFSGGRMKKSDDLGAKEKSILFREISRRYLELKKTKKIRTDLSILASPGVLDSKIASIEFGCGFICTFPNILGINSNGDIFPCDGLIGTKGMKLGNIRQKTMRQMWNSPIMKKLREVEEKNLIGVCKICNYKSFCQGGCRAATIKMKRNLNLSDPLCQAFYDQGVFPKGNLI